MSWLCSTPLYFVSFRWCHLMNDRDQWQCTKHGSRHSCFERTSKRRLPKGQKAFEQLLFDELSEAIQGGRNCTRFVRHEITSEQRRVTTGQGLIFPKYTYLVVMIAAVTMKLCRHHPPPVVGKWKMCYYISLNDGSSRKKKKNILVNVNIKWKKNKMMAGGSYFIGG